MKMLLELVAEGLWVKRSRISIRREVVRRRRIMLLLAVMAGLTGGGAARAATAPAQEAYTETFADETRFSPVGHNPYFVLEPGYVLILEGTEDGGHVVDVQTVLSETLTIDGVTVGVIEDRESKDGHLAEVTRDYYAISVRTNSVYYFGEDVDEYKNDKVMGHSGAWRSGVKGAKFGLIMPGLPLLGARYAQEIAPGVDLDRAVVAAVDETVTTPAGTFTHCLRTTDSNALEPGSATEKVYAPGIGVVRDGSLSLTKYGRGVAPGR